MTDPRCTHIYPGGERCSLDAETHAIPGVARRHGYPPTEAVVIPELCTPPEKWATASDAPSPARVTLTDDVHSLLALFPLDGTGHVVACGWDDASENPSCGCYSLPERLRDWLAAREAAVHAQIKADLLTEAENAAPEVPNAYREGVVDGLNLAARIAGGEQA